MQLQTLQAAANLADKMGMTLSISLPKPTVAPNRDSIPDTTKNRRQSALKSARAAGKAQLKADGAMADQDDIRIAGSGSTKESA